VWDNAPYQELLLWARSDRQVSYADLAAAVNREAASGNAEAAALCAGAAMTAERLQSILKTWRRGKKHRAIVAQRQDKS